MDLSLGWFTCILVFVYIWAARLRCAPPSGFPAQTYALTGILASIPAAALRIIGWLIVKM